MTDKITSGQWTVLERLDDTGLAGLAHAVHLEALVGQVTARNRLHRTLWPHPPPPRSSSR